MLFFSWFFSFWDPGTVDFLKEFAYKSEYPNKWWKMFDVYSSILKLLWHGCIQGPSAPKAPVESPVAEASCWWAAKKCLIVFVLTSFPAVSKSVGSQNLELNMSLTVWLYECREHIVFWCLLLLFYVLYEVLYVLWVYACIWYLDVLSFSLC